VAFLGPSGRGKSTTLLRAASAGWTPVAEDAAFVDVSTLTVVRADAHDHVRVRTSPESDDRRQVAFADLGGGATAARLTHLVRLVRGTASEPTWGPMSRADAVMALHEAVGVPTTRAVGRVLGPAFGDLVGRVETLTLDVGSPRAPLPALPHA
jgi:hypothetical protein